MDGLTPGRMVHYVTESGDFPNNSYAGEHRAAVVVRTFDGLKEQGVANLQVLCDGQNDGQNTLWKASATYDPKGSPGTWHWIERA